MVLGDANESRVRGLCTMSPHVVPFGAPIPNPGWPEPGLPRRHTSTSAYARRPAEDNDNVLFRGLGFVNCVFRNIAQGSGNRNHSIKCREGGSTVPDFVRPPPALPAHRPAPPQLAFVHSATARNGMQTITTALAAPATPAAPPPLPPLPPPPSSPL